MRAGCRGRYGTPGLVVSARGARRLLEAAAPFRRCVFAIDEFLPYLYNPEGHPRRGEHDLSQAYAHDRSSLGCVLTMALCLPAAIEAALGAPPPSPPLVALRYRGAAVLVQDKASASDVDGD